MGNNNTVNVIRHLAFEDLGSFTSLFQARNININYIDAGYDDLTQIDALADELLIVLGGPISVNDVDMFPFLETEKALLKQRVVADLPTLGICLGAQLIASAMGAQVFPGETKEIGWYDLELTAAGEQSALRYIGSNHTSMLHWHGETFELPDGAELLASSDLYVNQAFSLGNNILALQFHPEITQRAMEKWFIGHISEIMGADGVSVEGLREDTHSYANQLEVQGELFLNSWLNTLS